MMTEDKNNEIPKTQIKIADESFTVIDKLKYIEVDICRLCGSQVLYDGYLIENNENQKRYMLLLKAICEKGHLDPTFVKVIVKAGDDQ